MDISMWAGTEESFHKYLALQQYLHDHSVVTSGVQAFYNDYDDDDDDDDDDDQPNYGTHLLSKQGSTAVINISGSLVPKFSYYNMWFGLVSYEEITNAVWLADNDSSVKKIILKIASGGGAVSGLDEAAQYIKSVDKNSKPIYAHTSSQMASAAYWLAASTRKIYAAKVSEVGSIGVLMVHQSYSRLLNERGIDVKVFRAGKYKALGHPAEKLSPAAIAEFESKLNKTYNFFLEHVTSSRKVEISNKDVWAEGRVFYADDALAVKLIDGVKYFNEIVEILNVADDNPYIRMSVESQGSDDMTVKNVVESEQALAAIQSGASAAGLSTQVEEPTAEPTAEEGENLGQSEVQEPETQEEEEPTKTVVAGVDPGLYGETCAKVAVLEKELSDVKTELEAANSDSSALIGIAVKATNRLQIALNQSPTSLEGVSASVVLEQYSAVESQFNETFKVGAKATSVQTEADQKTHSARSGIYPVRK